MCSSFDDFPFFNDDDIISFFDGLESMGYDDNGSTLKEMLEGLSYFLFTITVESCCWFIEEDNLRILEKYFCYCESLFLSSTESDSSFSNFCIEAMLKLVNKMTFSELYSLCYSLSTYFTFCTVQQVFPYCSVKYRGLLCEVSYVRVVAIESYVSYILFVYSEASF